MLLIAIVAAITLTMRQRTGLKVQDIGNQVSVRRRRPRASRQHAVGARAMIGLAHYLLLAGILFAIAVAGIFINRKNVILLLMCIELMLLAVNFSFVAFSRFLRHPGRPDFRVLHPRRSRRPRRRSASRSWSCCSASAAAINVEELGHHEGLSVDFAQPSACISSSCSRSAAAVAMPASGGRPASAGARRARCALPGSPLSFRWIRLGARQKLLGRRAAVSTGHVYAWGVSDDLRMESRLPDRQPERADDDRSVTLRARSQCTSTRSATCATIRATALLRLHFRCSRSRC